LTADLLILCSGSDSTQDTPSSDQKPSHDLKCCLTHCRSDLSLVPLVPARLVTYLVQTSVACALMPPDILTLKGATARFAHQSRAPPVA